MPYSRVKSAGWSVNEKFTSTQCTQLDIDHSSALNGGLGFTDTLGSVVTMLASPSGVAASITTVVGSTVTMTGLSGLQAGIVGQNVTVSGAASGANNGTFPITAVLSATSCTYTNASGVASDGNNGSIHWSLSTPAASIAVAGTGCAVQAQVPKGLNASIAGGIASGITGGIVLSGGASDWPVFTASDGVTPAIRSRQLFLPGDACAGINIGSFVATGTVPFQAFTNAATSVSPGLSAGAMVTAWVSASNAGTNPYYWSIPKGSLHQGATLSSVQLNMTAANTHGSTLPGHMPSYGVWRTAYGTGVTTALLSGTPYVVDSSATGAAYKTLHTITFTPNQNNVIDVTTYTYWIGLWDEFDASVAQPGNTYWGFGLTQINIGNMAFG